MIQNEPCTFWINSLLGLLCLLDNVYYGTAVVDDPLPNFTNTPVNVTTYKGSEAILKCGVENLGTKTVGWRKLPYNVPITVGKDQFLELERFKLYRIPYKQEWNMHIKNAQLFDSGTYECQVSNKAQKIRRNVTLTVLDTPREHVSHPGIQLTGTQYVEKGASIQLVCNVTGHEYPPQSIDWFKDGRKLESNIDRQVYIRQHLSISEKTIVSAVEIKKAQLQDTGFYVCRASKLHQRIKVDVLNDSSLCSHYCGVHWLHNQHVNSAYSDETALSRADSSGSSLFTAETSNRRRDTNSGGALVYPSSDCNTFLFSKPTTVVTFICSIVITYFVLRISPIPLENESGFS